MAAVAAYESIEDAWAAHDLAQVLGSLTSLLPGIDQAYVARPGAEAEEIMTLEALQSFLANRGGHFAASLLCSGGIQSGDHSLSSMPMITIENLAEVRGLYLIFEAEELKRIIGDLVSCFDSLGEGFGYIAGTDDTSGTLDYMLDLDVIHDLDEIEAFLEPRERWQEHLRTPRGRRRARSLYPINIWPKSYSKILEKERSFAAAQETGQIRLLREYDHVDLFFAEEIAAGTLAGINDRFFFEDFRDKNLCWLDGEYTDEF